VRKGRSPLLSSEQEEGGNIRILSGERGKRRESVGIRTLEERREDDHDLLPHVQRECNNEKRGEKGEKREKKVKVSRDLEVPCSQHSSSAFPFRARGTRLLPWRPEKEKPVFLRQRDNAFSHSLKGET